MTGEEKHAQAPVNPDWASELSHAADELMKRGDFHHARIARALAKAVREGEPIDHDTFRQA